MDYEGCLVIVSHDRYFMDKIVDHLFVFKGGERYKTSLATTPTTLSMSNLPLKKPPKPRRKPLPKRTLGVVPTVPFPKVSNAN